jgi:hypothetical protein
MRKVVYIQFTNPELYPPLEHGSKILVQNGWECHFLGRHSAMTGKIAFATLSGRTVECMPKWSMRLPAKLEFMAYAAWAILKVVRMRPDALYLSDALVAPIGVFLHRIGYRVVYHEHDTPDPTLARWLHRARRQLFRLAAFSVIPNAKRIVQEALEIQELLEVRNFPSQAEVVAAPPLATDGLVLCYFGTLVPSRLPLSFFETLEACGLDIEVQLMGYETVHSKDYVKELAERFSASAKLRIEFLGAFPRREMLERAAQANAGLLLFSNPNDVNEGTMVGGSNKIGDYLAAGIPMLCERTGEFEELSRELDGIYPVGEETDLTELLLRLKDRYANAGARIALQEQIKMRFNYETEFGPVLKRLSAMLKA